jgi:beta-lactamase regulating signal transducer with metallopeptidase domain
MTPWDFQSVSQAFAGRALNTIAEGVALAGFSWLMLRFVRTGSAITRFAVWFSTLLAIVFMPLLLRTGSPGMWQRPQFEIASSWATYLFMGWAVVATGLLIRLAGSLVHVRRLRRACREMNSNAAPELFETLRQSDIRRKVKIFISDEVRVPTALGFFQPSILFPAWTLAQLSPEELKVILLHELAHLRRWDDWTNLIQKVLKAVFFFHPAVWWIEGRLSLEREMACDDLVLEQTGSASSYAASLVSVAEKAFSEKTRAQRALALAQSAIGRVRQTSTRIAQILDPGRTGVKSGWRPALTLTSGLLAVVLFGMPFAPELISFERNDQTFRASSRATTTPEMQVPAKKASERIPVHAAANAHVDLPARVARLRTMRTPTVIPARAKVSSAADAKVVQAKAEPEQNRILRTLLVVRSTRFEASGSTGWTLCVWRVAVHNDGSSQIEETIVVHSI